jgi:hypothetical protein
MPPSKKNNPRSNLYRSRKRLKNTLKQEGTFFESRGKIPDNWVKPSAAVGIGKMLDNPIPKRNDEYHVDEIDGEILLYHAAKTKSLRINETAAMVWYLCDSKRSQAEIVELLVDSYPEVAASIPADVQETINQFVEFGGLSLE